MAPGFAGCWDKIELEEQGYVAVIGMDKGKGNNVRITFQITNPQTIAPGNQGSNAANKSIIIAIDAPGILSARELVTTSFTRRITLAHAKAIIVGEDFAQTDRFFQSLEGSLRDKELRRAMTLIVSRESAEDFIRKNEPVLEDRMHKYYEFMGRRWKDTALVPPMSNINRFIQRTESKGSLFLSIYATAKEMAHKEGADEGGYIPGQIEREGGNPAEMIGAAVFRNGKMVGRLSGNDMRLVSFLREEIETKSMLVTFEDPLDPNYRIGARIEREKKTRVKVDVSNSRPEIDVMVPLSMEILAIPSFIPYVEDLSKQAYLEKYLEDYLEKISMQLIEKTQQEFKGDPFRWNLAVRREFLDLEEYQKYDWIKRYPEAVVNLSYDIKFTNFGKQLNPPQKPKQNEDLNDSVL